jgi:hypothetical protein
MSGLFNANLRFDNSEGTLCVVGTQSCFYIPPFTTGTIIYSDTIGTLFTGFTFVADGGGVIYNLDSVTAEVGAPTGGNC